MIAREQGASALRPMRARTCIVMVCANASETDQVACLLSQQNNGILVTYPQAEDLALDPPLRKVLLVILASDDSTQVITRTLRWLRTRLPHCPLAVVGNVGGGEYEITARTGGAMYLTRPVTTGQWSGMLRKAQQMVSRSL